MKSEQSNQPSSELMSLTKGTSEKLLDILLPRAISEAESQEILKFVSEKNAFSKKQSLFLVSVAARGKSSQRYHLAPNSDAPQN